MTALSFCFDAPDAFGNLSRLFHRWKRGCGMLSMSAPIQAAAVMLVFFYLFLAGLAVPLLCRGRRVRLLAGLLCLTAGASAAAYNARHYDLLWMVEPGAPSIFVIGAEGEGIRLMDPTKKPIFIDLDGDGIRERVGWARPNAGVLLLDDKVLAVWDPVNDRPVGGLAKLLWRLGIFWRDGMAPLRDLDDNGDGLVTESDKSFDRISLWRDGDVDGVIREDEIWAAQHLDLILAMPSLWLEQDFYDNRVLATGWAIVRQRMQMLVRMAPARDAVFAIRPPIPAGLDRKRVADLPNLSGYGRVHRLHDAMLLDEDLRRRVVAFAALGPGDFHNWRSQTEALLFSWSGVVDRPEGRRRHDTLVAIYNDDWRPFHPQPGNPVAASVEAAWGSFHRRMHANLVLQGPMREVFPGLAYDIRENTMLLEGRQPPMAALVAGAAALEPPGDRVAYWCEMVAVLDTVQRRAGDAAYDPALQAALAPLGLSPSQMRDTACR